jgi:predicted metal-dependent HD superfamily phosphohydrolase
MSGDRELVGALRSRRESLAARWPLDDHVEVRDALLAAYADPSRGYHDTLHLAEVLDRLDELADAGLDVPRVPTALAAWFHDAVYDGRPGAEERSGPGPRRPWPARRTPRRSGASCA